MTLTAHAPAADTMSLIQKMAYPASKLAPVKELRESGELVGSAVLLRVGGKDGQMETLPRFAESQKWHPAKKFGWIQHRDIDTAVNLAPTGVMDARVVNIFDEAATSVNELLNLVESTMDPLSTPPEKPWSGHASGSLACSLGFKPTIATVHQAERENAL